MEPMRTQIHELRTRIDGLAQLVNSIPEKPKRRTYQEDGRDWVQLSISNGTTVYMPLVYETERRMIYQDWMKEHCPEPSEELKDCHKSLLLSKEWLGKVLAELREEQGEDASSGEGLFKDDFELLWWKNELNYIEKIDWLREEIQKQIDSIEEILHPVNIIDSEVDDQYYFILSEQHLAEACFHLQFELSRLKEQTK